MRTPIKKVRAGYYETHGGEYFMYSYRAEDGSGTWWVLYRRTSDEEQAAQRQLGHPSGDEFISTAPTLRALRNALDAELPNTVGVGA